MLLKIATRRITSSIDVHVALELTGLTKCFGHPEVVMDESVAAWIDKGSVMKKVLEEVAEEIRRAFVLEFSRNFYKAKRKWPNLEFRPGHDPYIKQCYDGVIGARSLTSREPQHYLGRLYSIKRWSLTTKFTPRTY